MARKTKVEVGREYGHLTVIGLKHEYRSGRVRLVAECICRCGEGADPLTQDLASGKTRSCGCGGGALQRTRSRRKGIQRPDLIGWVVGHMTVTDAWETGKTVKNGYGKERKEFRLELQCPRCPRHIILEIGTAETLKPRSCGCSSRPRFPTVERKAEMRRSYYETSKELKQEAAQIEANLGRPGEFFRRGRQSDER